MDRAFYAEYSVLERKHWWFLVRANIIMDRVRILSEGRRDLKILNVGSGPSYTSQLLEEFGEVKSIEYDQICADMVKDTLGIDIEQGSITELRFEDNQYDLVTAFDVVEHVEDDALAVSELHRVCKPGGHVLITIPAFMSLWSHHDVVNQHFKRYRKPEIRELFANLSGSEKHQSYFNSILFIPIWTFRTLSNLFPKSWTRSGAGSDATVGETTSPVDALLKFVFGLERPLMRMGIKFPFGVSFLYLFKKK